MHAVNHNILLIGVASSSFAALIFSLFYILYIESDDAKKRKVVNVTGGPGGEKESQKVEYTPEALQRPKFLSRAIGGSDHKNIQSLRSFRAANMLLVTLPIAFKLYRERMAEERANAIPAK